MNNSRGTEAVDCDFIGREAADQVNHSMTVIQRESQRSWSGFGMLVKNKRDCWNRNWDLFANILNKLIKNSNLKRVALELESRRTRRGKCPLPRKWLVVARLEEPTGTAEEAEEYLLSSYSLCLGKLLC